MVKNNTIIGNVTNINNIDMKNDNNKNNDNSPSSKNLFNTEKINKSTKNLEIKKINLKENSKFSLFDKISSFSHQFDEYKSNDLIDAYYF